MACQIDSLLQPHMMRMQYSKLLAKRLGVVALLVRVVMKWLVQLKMKDVKAQQESAPATLAALQQLVHATPVKAAGMSGASNQHLHHAVG